MSVKIREVRGRLYLSIYQHGERWLEGIGLCTSSDPVQRKEVARLAESIRSRREQQLAAQTWGVADPSRSRISLVAYAEEIAKTKKPSHHIHKSMPYLREHAGDIHLRAVDADWLDGYKRFLLSRDNLAQVTASHYYSALVNVLHLAVRAKLLPRSPTEDTRGIPVPEPMKPHLTRDEVVKMAAHPLGGELGYEIYRGFLFACLVGLRVSDVTAFRFADIEMRTDPQKPGEVKPCIIRRQKKTTDVVYVPVNAAAMRIVGEGDPGALVFPRLSQSKTSPTQYFRTWAKAAGVHKAVGWHMSRHTFAVRLLEEGVDIYTVSKLLGHTDIKTTMAYAKATDGMKRAAVDKLPEIEVVPRP